MNKKKLVISSAIALVLTGTAGAVIQHTQSGAEEIPPIVTQVQDHEGRITGLEQKQQSTDAKVDQNASDIQTLQQSSAASSAAQSAQSGADTQSAGSTGSNAPAGSQPADAPAQSPVVTPPPATNPRTITAVQEQLDGVARTCRYTLYNDGVKPRVEAVVYMAEKQPQCFQVGEVLPR